MAAVVLILIVRACTNPFLLSLRSVIRPNVHGASKLSPDISVSIKKSGRFVLSRRLQQRFIQYKQEYDATLLLRDHGAFEELDILIDQGTDDQFLQEKQLLPEAFEAVCKEVGQKYTLNMRVSCCVEKCNLDLMLLGWL